MNTASTCESTDHQESPRKATWDEATWDEDTWNEATVSATTLQPPADNGTGGASPRRALPGAPTPRRTVPLEELRRAWAALEAGRYRTQVSTSQNEAHRPTTRRATTGPVHSDTACAANDAPTGNAALAANAADSWMGRLSTMRPGSWAPATDELVLPVIGCGGSVGASTVAVALATTYAAATTATASTADPTGITGAATAGSHGPTVTDGATRGRRWAAARVVDCGSLTESGISAASTVELGRHPSGWWRGTRGDVLLERAGGYVTGPDAVPVPCPWPEPSATVQVGGRLTVVDVGWDLERVLHHPSWVRSALLSADAAVLVTTATVPGLRCLEVCLDLLSDATIESTDAVTSAGRWSEVMAVVLGPPRRRWPRAVGHGLGPRTRCLDREGRVTVAPYDRGLAVNGLDPAPLATPLLKFATGLLNDLSFDRRGATP